MKPENKSCFVKSKMINLLAYVYHFLYPLFISQEPNQAISYDYNETQTIAESLSTIRKL